MSQQVLPPEIYKSRGNEMESTISLAISVKLKKIFEDDDNFLTLPLGIGFSNKYLHFMDDTANSGLTLQEQLNYNGDFARLMNIIPEDTTMFSADASNFLWDEVKYVLHDAIFASSTLSEQEDKLLAQALDYLTDVKTLDDGAQITVDSPEVKNYYYYQDVYYSAEHNYLNEKLTVESALDPEGDKLRAQWGSSRKQELTDIKDKAESDWKNLGFKEIVENYMSIKNNLELKKYPNKFRQDYLNDIALSEISDLKGVGIGFYTTFFSPLDAFSTEQPWSSITLTKEEINDAIEEAPDDLKTIFNVKGKGNIVTMMIEEIEKFVLHAPLGLKVKILTEMAEKVLHGKDIFTVTREEFQILFDNAPQNLKDAWSDQWACTDIKSISLEYKVIIIIRPWFKPEFFSSRYWKLSGDVMVSNGNRPVKGKIPSYITGMIVARNVKIVKEKDKPVKPLVIPIIGNLPIQQLKIPEKKIPAREVRPARDLTPINTIQITQKQKREFIQTKYIGKTIETPVSIQDKNVPTNIGSGSYVETYNFDGVTALAFIAKRIPKSPNPDNALNWG